MIQSYKNINIAGINGAVPNNPIHISELIENSPKEKAFKIKRTAMLAGLKTRYVASQATVKDLAVHAGNALLKNLNWEKNSVNAIFLVTVTPELLMPSTSYAVHHGLNLSENCIATDIIASCSGLIHGIWAASAHISEKCPRILVFAGDTKSKILRSDDIGNQILFGDGMGAVALEFNPNSNNTLTFNLTSYPDTENILFSAGSGIKDLNVEKGFHMQGDKIAEFSQTKTVENISALLENQKLSLNDIEILFPHQANLALLEILRKKLDLASEKMPTSIDLYANCSCANIALLVADYFSKNPDKSFSKALFCGFGGGLAVASMLASISAKQCFPIEYLNEK